MVFGIVAEKNRLCRSRRQQRDDALQGMDEAEVEHLVGLVEHQDLDVAQAQSPAVDEVEEAARRRDENVDAGGQLALLLADRNAAEHDCGREPQVTPIGAEAVGDLARRVRGSG